MKFKRVGVLMGGISAEREVSFASGKAVSKGLSKSGFDVVEIDVDRNLDESLRKAKIEAAYIALHGRWGEDGTVQGMLEIMGIPYTGSSLASSALCMDKIRTRDALQASGLPVAKGFAVQATADLPEQWDVPVVVKPADEGSSFGVSIVKDKSQYKKALETALSSSRQVLVEKFTKGTEINVAILNGEILGSVEIEPHREFYDFEAKYEDGGSTHHIPPRIEKQKIEQVQILAQKAFKTLGCSGAARIDLIVPEKEKTIILEANTIPGMTPTSLLPEIASHAGITFIELVNNIMNSATLHVG